MQAEPPLWVVGDIHCEGLTPVVIELLPEGDNECEPLWVTPKPGDGFPSISEFIGTDRYIFFDGSRFYRAKTESTPAGKVVSVAN